MLGLGAFALPHAAFADVQTVQILPPGRSACTPPAISGFTPYIYEGGMHSFEFYVSDASYVAVAGLVGETPVPFYYVSRRNMDGTLRIHVDLPTTNIRTNTPIQITMLSMAAPGLPTCLSAFSTSVSRETTPAAHDAQERPTPKPLTENTGKMPEIAVAPKEEASGATPVTTQKEDFGRETEKKESATKNPIVSAFSTLGQVVVSMCSAKETTKRLWAFLVAVFALLIVGIVFGTLPAISNFSPVYMKLAAIAIPLILLAGLWVLSPACRPGVWPLFALTALSVAAAYGVFQDTKFVQGVIQLPPGTPPRN